MYNIMLVEDEPEVLDAIIETIDWASFSFEKPVGCRDGSEAVRVIDKGFRPDVLLTDICMPFTDGLELTKYIIEKHPKTVVVILSGYNEFSYAQKALQMKVYDYMLKPVTPNSINELLSRLSKELSARRINDIEDSIPVLQRHFLHRLLERSIDASVVEENCLRYRISFSCYNLVAVLDADNVLPADADPKNEFSLELFRYALSNIATELSEAKGYPACQAQNGTSMLIIGGKNADDCRNTAAGLVSEISDAVQRYLPGTISAGIGVATELVAELHLSREQAVEALSYRFFQGESSILFYEDIRTREDSPTTQVDVSVCYRDFESAIMLYDKQATRDVVTALFALLAENRCSLDRYMLCCQRLTMILYQFADKFGGGHGGRAIEQMWEQAKLLDASTIGQMESKMLALCERVSDQFEPYQDDSASAQVVKAESYIHEHYGNPDLSLQSITEYLAVSVSYFSATFKARTGQTFVEYLTKIRMDKAKQLLLISDRRSYEIAADVGFSDPHYFSAAFKRFTGISPREFREYGSANK